MAEDADTDAALVAELRIHAEALNSRMRALTQRGYEIDLEILTYPASSFDQTYAPKLKVKVMKEV